jgi:putative nucleotidyltransferase with HDIG domain
MPEEGTNSRTLIDFVNEHLSKASVLPLMDQTAARIHQMVQSDACDIREIERLVVSDPGLTGPLLRISNSPFFGGIEKVVTVRDAIVRLGVKKVSDLVMVVSQQKMYRLRDPHLQGVVRHLWSHSVACAAGSDWLVRKLGLREVQEQAFLAGLLHDVGKLLLLRVVDDLRGGEDDRFTLSSPVVFQVLDELHASQGYALMREWNIPEVYAEIVRDHHVPSLDESNPLLAVVRLVDLTCNRLGIGIHGKQDIDVATRAEARCLRMSEVGLAELEVHLEDAMQLAS